MQDQRWYLSKMNLSDAKNIQPETFGLTSPHNKTEWENWLRGMKHLCGGLVFWIGAGCDEETALKPMQADAVKALVGYQQLESLSASFPVTRPAAGTSAQLLPAMHGTGKTAHLHVFAKDNLFTCHEPRQEKTQQRQIAADVENLISQITAYAFETLGIYRLVWRLRTDQLADWQETLESSSWQQVGLARKGIYDEITRRHHDVVIYTLCAPESDQFGTAFVLFKQGLLSVSGSKKAVLAAGLTHFGQSFGFERQQESADWLDLLDQHGHVLAEAKLKKKFDKQIWLCPDKTPEPVKEAAIQAAEYFRGQRQNFSLTLELPGVSAFQKKVLKLLADIPYGETCTYGDLARMISPDDPKAERKLSRAVGHACGANPLPVFLPCHRVIGSDGKLTGFSSGLDIKEYLLAHEIMGLS